MRRNKRLDKIHWRVVEHERRLYLIEPSGTVNAEGNYGDWTAFTDKARKLNRQLEVERLVRRGKL